jgi:hypothetical protein
MQDRPFPTLSRIEERHNESVYRMARFFYGNFDFEHRLADPGYEPSAALKRLNAELATAWLAVAEDGDWIWTPLSIDSDFFVKATQQGLPSVVPVTSLSDVPRDVNFVPWGWSSEVRNLANQFGWNTDAPVENAVRLANSRATSNELEDKGDFIIDGSRKIESPGQLDEAIQVAHASGSRWVIKAEFGMSARERILGKGPATEADKNWVRHRLTQHGAVFFEPWLERVNEVGIQIEIKKNEPPELIGVSSMLVNDRGQYAGSWFAGHESRLSANKDLWQDAISTALKAATHLKSLGYFGPLGIDAMLYRDKDGTLRIRPLQDINARWTMGRLSLGLQRLIRTGDNGLWLHGPTGKSHHEGFFANHREIATSPERVGNEPCRHSSRIWISEPETR